MDHLTDDVLFEYLDDELATADRRRVAAHLGTCPACAAKLVEWRALLGDVEAVPEVALTVDLSAAVVEGLSAETTLTTAPAVRWLTVAELILAAIVLTLGWPLLQLASRADTLLATPALQPITLSLTQRLSLLWSTINAPFATGFTRVQTELGPLPSVSLSITVSLILLVAVALLWAISTRIALRDLESHNS